MTELVNIYVSVNGDPYAEAVEPRMLLSDFLRHQLGLTGTRVGCEHGVCGACTIIFDGQAIRSCLMLAVQAHGHEIRTVESLGSPDNLSGFQRAMMDEHGLQCGFCTSGILMSVTAAQESGASSEQVKRDVLDGHICRCTGYMGIRAAIDRHWSERQER